jgi:hypothetical protein
VERRPALGPQLSAWDLGPRTSDFGLQTSALGLRRSTIADVYFSWSLGIIQRATVAKEIASQKPLSRCEVEGPRSDARGRTSEVGGPVLGSS